MAEKKKDSDFKVSDRRLFTADGELRTPSAEEEEAQPEQATPARAAAAAATKSAEPAPAAHTEPDAPPPPSATEQQAQHDAYRESARDLDRQVELSGHSAKDLQVDFKRFVASLYMTAMVQLGLMHERGAQPDRRPDWRAPDRRYARHARRKDKRQRYSRGAGILAELSLRASDGVRRGHERARSRSTDPRPGHRYQRLMFMLMCIRPKFIL